MSTSPDFGVPLLASQQVQPEITHNESVVLLTVVQKGVINATTNTPPGSPTEGDAYIVNTSPTGAWAGKSKTIAIYYNGGWKFWPGNDSNGTQITPSTRHEGMRVWDQTLNALQVFDGSSWSAKYLLAAGQQTAVADASGGSTVDTEARAAINALLARARTLGLSDD
jgi:hypothetical protein